MTLLLPALLDTNAAGPLRRSLREALAAGHPLTIDGSAVEQAGQACLQVLAAGKAAAGGDFRIADPSPGLVAMATLAGLGDLLPA